MLLDFLTCDLVITAAWNQNTISLEAMVRLHSSTLIGVLRLVVFIALLLSLHYVFSLIRKFNSEKEIIRDEDEHQQVRLMN